MLIGQYSNAIDDKGRLSIPAKLRNEIDGDYLVAAPGIDSCIRLFTPSKWEEFVQEIMGAGSLFQKEIREAVRALISPALECEIDKAGRILLPVHLRERANLGKEVYVLGAIEYIEVWNPETYAVSMEGKEGDVQGAAERIGDFYASKKKEQENQ